VVKEKGTSRINGTTRVELGEQLVDPEAGEKLFIPRQPVHRLSAVGEGPVRILEISFGEFDEEDIVRLEDLYGRVGSSDGNRPPETAQVVMKGRPRRTVGV
jgi:Mannose-6-phosphate isomerase